MTQVIHQSFATTSERGLRHDILPMRLYHKAKKLGIWSRHDRTLRRHRRLGELPFGMKMEEYLSYATMQFSKRIASIERAREQTLEQLYQLPELEIGEE